MNNERFDNNDGRIGANLMKSFIESKCNSSKEERKEKSEYFNTFHMYCENHVIDRLERLRKKLTDKNLMFKFDGNKYAIFPLCIKDRARITDYVLTLEEVENFAEKSAIKAENNINVITNHK